MTRPTFILQVIASVLCCVLALPSIAGADEPAGQGAAKAAGSGEENIEVQLAKARLALAKVELDRVLKANERIGTAYTDSTVALLRSNLDMAAARLKALSGGNAADVRAAHLRELESDLAIAELRWKTAVQLHKSVPTSIDAEQVEARRLRVEVARLALARARQPAHETTPLELMQWQLNRLQQQLLDVTVRVDEIANRN